MSLDGLKPGPLLDTVRFESEPPGAEAKVSNGQTCRTPCALALPTDGPLTVTFNLNGYQPESEKLDMVQATGSPPALRPNPVMVELTVAPPPAKPARKPASKKPTAKKPTAKKPAAKPSAARSQPATAAAPPPAMAAPAQQAPSPWPSAPQQQR